MYKINLTLNMQRIITNLIKYAALFFLQFIMPHSVYADALATTADIIGPSAVQSDGKLLVTGYRKTNNVLGPNGEQLSNQLFIKRINSDGLIDSAFGMSGELKFSIFGDDDIQNITLQPDGKILLVASAKEPCVSRYMTMGLFTCTTIDNTSNPSHEASSIDNVVLRLTSSGEMDKSFNKTGMIRAPIPKGYYQPSLVIMADGDIIIATSYTYSSFYPKIPIGDISLAVLTTDGSLVNTFYENICRNNKRAGRLSLFPNPNGSFVLAANFDLDFPCLVQLKTDGTKDLSFGSMVFNWKGIGLSSFRGISKAEDGGYIVYGVPKECQSTAYSCSEIKSFHYNSNGEFHDSYTDKFLETKNTAFEYFNIKYNHYFITADPQESAIVDTNPDWKRTGQSYIVNSNTTQSQELLPVCRFFSQKFTSHFYALAGSECDTVKNNQDWRYEKNAFFVGKPVDGRGYTESFCQNDATPVYRLYNKSYLGAPNHRYTICTSLRDTMVSHGWAFEGVTMCIAPQNSDCTNDASDGSAKF